MDYKMEVFLNRWETIEHTTMMAVQSQFKMDFFSIKDVNEIFQNACAEWFSGNLAPSVWYKQLMEEDMEKAREFREYVTHISIPPHGFSEPLLWMSYVVAVLMLVVCYCVLSGLTEMGMVSKLILSAGAALGGWLVCRFHAKKRSAIYQKEILCFYRTRFKEYLNHIMGILA